jgi:hypothetical protein
LRPLMPACEDTTAMLALLHLWDVSESVLD